MEDLDFVRALKVLEPLPRTPDILAQWQQLGEAALDHGHLTIARKCYVVCGNICKALYLGKVQKLSRRISKERKIDGFNSNEVQSKLAILQKQWNKAENIILTNEGLDATIDMYINYHK